MLETIAVPGFNRTFFKNISDLLEDYYKTYPCSVVTLTLRVLNEEYNVAKILKADDTLLTFSFYSFVLLRARQVPAADRRIPGKNYRENCLAGHHRPLRSDSAGGIQSRQSRSRARDRLH